jgi:hypothetical protein
MIRFILIFFLTNAEANISYDIQNNISNEDLLLASVLESECSYCSDIDKFLILSSILNRCENENYPNNIENVLEAYSKTNIKNISKTNLNFVLFFDYNLRDTSVLYFFNENKSTDKSFIKFIRKKTKLIYKNKYHEYRGN